MTETDATKRPLTMPKEFIPYLEKYRIYKLFKDMLRDLVINLPKDHLKHMRIFFARHLHSIRDTDRVIMLVSPELKIDVKAVAKQMIKDLGFFVITRRCVMDRYEKHDDCVPGCISPVLMSEVTKLMTIREPVPQAGWLMFDHPCTVREARTLQQDGVLPTVTLALIPTPPVAPKAPNLLTTRRNFFQQDFEGLKFAYKATLKEVHIDPEDDVDRITNKCLNAVKACSVGQQGPGQGFHVTGAPGTFRVLLIGPHGAGRTSQGIATAKHFGLVYLNFNDLLKEAEGKMTEIGERLRKFGPSPELRADIVRERLKQKDCIDNGWVMTGYPTCGRDLEALDNMPTPPNHIIFLNADMPTCKERILSQGVDWCTGQRAPRGAGPRVRPPPEINLKQLDDELDYYFTEALAELRAAAGITADEVNALEPFDKVQVKIQSCIMAAPEFVMEISSQRLRSAYAD